MVELGTRGAAGQVIRLTPNRSISREQLVLVFAGLSFGCLGLAATLAVQGYWPSLPFAGAGVLALGLALRRVSRRSARVEELRIENDHLSVVQRWPGHAVHHRFQLAWLRVELRPGRHRWYPRRLVVASHGRELELGTFLAEPERKQVADRLMELAGRPPPPAT